MIETPPPDELDTTPEPVPAADPAEPVFKPGYLDQSETPAEVDAHGTPYDPEIHRSPAALIQNGRNKGRWRLTGNTRYPRQPGPAAEPKQSTQPRPDFPDVNPAAPAGQLPKLDLAGQPHPDTDDTGNIPEGQISYTDAEMLQATADTHLCETLTIAAFAEGYSKAERDQVYAATCAMRHHYQNLPKEPVWLVCASTLFAVTTAKYQKPKCNKYFRARLAAIVGRVRGFFARRKEAAAAVEKVTGPPAEPVEDIYTPPPPQYDRINP